MTTGTGRAADSLDPTLRATTTLLAKKPGTYAFKPVSLIVFDPVEARYRTVSSNILKLTVLEKKDRTAADTTGSQQSIAPVEKKSTPALPPFILPLALFLLLAAALSFILLKKRPGANRKTAGTLQELRKEIEAAVYRRCNEQSDTVEMNNLSSTLKKAGVDEETVRKTTEMIETLDRLEYSPDKPDRAEFEKLCSECRLLSTRLRSRSSRWGRFFSPRS